MAAALGLITTVLPTAAVSAAVPVPRDETSTAAVPYLPLDGTPVFQQSDVMEGRLPYAVTLTAGQRIQLLCETATKTRAATLVYGPDGKLVKADIGTDRSSCAFGTFGENQLFTAVTAGTYQVVVRGIFGPIGTVAVGATPVLPDVTTVLAADGTPVTVATTGAYQRVQATVAVTRTAQQLTVICDRDAIDGATVLLFRSPGSLAAAGRCEGLGDGVDAAVTTPANAGEWTIVVDPDGTFTNDFTLRARVS